MYYVRGSELESFLRCRLQWKYAWVDGLKAKKPNNKLLFGTLFHKFLEVLYSTQDPLKAAEALGNMYMETDTSHMDFAELDEIQVLIDHVTINYLDEYYDTDIQNWEVIATELTFAIPLNNEIGYTGTIDLIVRDKRDGKIYFLDHKTTSSLDNYDKNSDLDRQISRYWWALQQLQQGKGTIADPYNKEYFYPVSEMAVGLKLAESEIGGFTYNLVLKDFPVPPKVLKNGSLSKDKSQKTTVDLYKQAIKDNNLDANDYLDMLIHLADNPKEFFRRINVHRTQSEIDASIRELYMTAMDMFPPHVRNPFSDMEWRPDPAIYRNITKDCPWCPFQPLCAAEIRGDNVQFLKDSLYTVEPTER